MVQVVEEEKVGSHGEFLVDHNYDLANSKWMAIDFEDHRRT